MKEQFINWNPRGASLELVTTAEAICLDWAGQGYDLTVRQLYYQLVSRDVIANNLQSYKRLVGLLDNARLAGLIDWSHIVDRTRNVYRTQGADTTPADAIQSMAGSYSLPRWDNQPNHVEVWVEKEALSGIIETAAREVAINYFACRGYVSQSEMYDSGRRFGRIARRKPVHVIHLGDHDPSGLDMTRDITARLAMFSYGGNVTVTRVALNMDQIEQYGPPPNPAKQTDARFEAYAAEYGDESWELDALAPSVIHDLIVGAVRPLMDQDAWDAVEQQEAEDRERLQTVASNWEEYF
jgi:hypothetical protein